MRLNPLEVTLPPPLHAYTVSINQKGLSSRILDSATKIKKKKEKNVILNLGI
jgi:hypothetical protein